MLIFSTALDLWSHQFSESQINSSVALEKCQTSQACTKRVLVQKRFTIIIHKQYAYGREAPDPGALEEGSVSRVRLAEGLNLRLQTCLQIISYLVSFPVPFASLHVTISGPSVPF